MSRLKANFSRLDAAQQSLWPDLADRDGRTVKVSFFGSIGFGRVGTPELTEDGVGEVASLLDLAATKVKVVQQRAEAKDYRDILALVGSGLSLEDALAAARAIYGTTFQASESLKALTYFVDGDLPDLTEDERRELIAIAAAVDRIPTITKVSEHLGPDPPHRG